MESAPATTQEPFHLIRFSPQGHLVALVHGSSFSLFNPGEKRFLRLEGQQQSAHHHHHTDLIRSVAWSRDGSLLATGGDDKVVKLWRIHPGGCAFSFHGQTQKHSKKLTSVVMGSGSEGEVVLYSDKFGDVFSVPAAMGNEKPTLLLGHVSIITDLLLSPGGDFLLSSDRDEKVRVSQYPKTYNIQSYCLGHTGLVSKILIPASHPDLLCSGSGDGTVRLWRYAPTSELLHREDRDQADEAITLPVAFSDAKQILVVLVQGENAVYLYKLVGGNQLKQEHVLPLCSAPYDAALDGEGNLWVTTFGGLEIFASSEGDTFSPVEEGHALSLTRRMVDDSRKLLDVKTVESNAQALSYSSMRKRKKQAEATTNATNTTTQSKEKRKQTRKKQRARGKSEEQVTPMEEVEGEKEPPSS